jgi:Na+/melibiose symporter-like transporter
MEHSPCKGKSLYSSGHFSPFKENEGLFLAVASMNMSVFYDTASCSLTALVAEITSETSVSVYKTTRRNIPEDVTYILAAVRT